MEAGKGNDYFPEPGSGSYRLRSRKKQLVGTNPGTEDRLGFHGWPTRPGVARVGMAVAIPRNLSRNNGCSLLPETLFFVRFERLTAARDQRGSIFETLTFVGKRFLQRGPPPRRIVHNGPGIIVGNIRHKGEQDHAAGIYFGGQGFARILNTVLEGNSLGVERSLRRIVIEMQAAVPSDIPTTGLRGCRCSCLGVRRERNRRFR